MLRRTILKSSAQLSLISTHGPFRLLSDTTKQDGVITIEIKGNKKPNLMDDAFMKGLLSATSELNSMDNARVAVLKAAEGHHFCAGLDLKGTMEVFMKDVPTSKKIMAAASAATGVGSPTMGETSSGMPAMRNMHLHQLIKLWQDAISSVARCRIPVIAAVDKYCIGGAVDLITACDFRYSTHNSTFSVREAKVGIVADIGTLQRLGRIVGEGNARELSYTARDFQGQEAQELKLINKSFETAEELYAHVDKVAAEIAANSPMAVQGTKDVLNQQTERAVQDSLDYVRMWNTSFLKSDDLVRAGLAFAQKKKPVFHDYVVDSRSSTPTSVGVKGE